MSEAVLGRLVIWVWFGVAVTAGYQGLLRQTAAVTVPLLVVGLSAFAVYAYFRFRLVRAWLDGMELRSLVLLHLTRFVGIYFLFLHQRGELPGAFAVPAGFGDIFVATFVLPVVFAPLGDAERLRVISIWNVVGFVDILLVIFTAARLNLADPEQMEPFTRLPLSLLPTFLVPLLIASHVILFVRVARLRSGSQG